MTLYNNDMYKVSVRLMTYNHEPFIKNAMDGIMMQHTNFMIEVVVGDDFSKDRTLEIIEEYKNSERVHINILRRRIGDEYWKKRQAIGRLYNFVNILENCKGEYIALLDGDDYWTDPLKLQKQIDFLEEHKGYVLTCGGFRSISKGKVSNVINSIANPIEDDGHGFTFTLKDISNAWLTKNLTSTFRNRKEIYPLLLNYENANNGVDVFLYYHLLKEGDKGYYFKEIFGVYNIHAGGIFSLKPNGKRLRDNYYIYRELYTVNKDDHCRYRFLRQCLKIMYYKSVHFVKVDDLSTFTLLKNIIRLIRFKSEMFYLVKLFIRKQAESRES